MATYNRESFIIESLSSIKEQSFGNFECLIVDDGSQDKTKEVVWRFIESDGRFKFLNRPEFHKKGLPGCRNYGLSQAKGNYIIFFDDDDIPHPDLLKWSLREVTKNNVDFCRFQRSVFYGSFSHQFNREEDYFLEDGKNMTVENQVTGKVPFNSCQILWRRGLFEGNLFNEELMFAEEWELYSRILAQGAKGVSIDKVLYFGRKHPNSNTGEYQRNDSIRKGSKILATILIIKNLQRKALLNERVIKFFVRLGFELNSHKVLVEVLKASNASLFLQFKYRTGFVFYPLLRPLFKLKGKVFNS